MRITLRRAASILAALGLLVQLFCPAVGWAAPEDGIPADAAATVTSAGPEPEEDPAASAEPALSPAAEADALVERDMAGEMAAFNHIAWHYENSDDCTFRVAASLSDPDVTEADAVVWTMGSHAEVRRISAQNLGSVWTAGVDIADFHYAYTTYYVQIVGRDSAGAAVAQSDITEVDIGPEQIEMEVRPADMLGSRYRLVLSSEVMPGRPDVWFEVRSADGAVLKSLPAERQDGAYTALLTAADLAAAGDFSAVVCCGHAGECSQDLASAALEVDRLTYAGLSIQSDGTLGTFRYALYAQSPLGITGARIAIWSEENQQDLQWFDMTPAAGGFESPLQNVHSYSGFGTYTAHVYVRLGDGSELLAAGLETVVTARNCVWTEKEASGRYNIYIAGPSPARNLRMAVWSEENGQDDLVWYPASAQGGSLFMATAVTSKHASGGTWFAHVYSGDVLLGGTSFMVPESELLSAAEQRIAAGCQKVYNAVGTDLHRVYLWVVNNLSYVRRSGHLTPPSGYTRQQWYAVEGLEKRSGNCYTYAATFCELARGLGYNARYVEGAVYGVGQKWWPHGFVLITIDGSTYICDPELQYASSAGRNLYMQPISSPRATYRW